MPKLHSRQELGNSAAETRNVIMITLNHASHSNETRNIVKARLGIYDNYRSQGEEWILKAKELWRVKQAIKQLEKEETILLQTLKDASEGFNSIGGMFVFEGSIRKGSVDYAKIPELKSVDLEHYRKESVELWKLTLRIEDE